MASQEKSANSVVYTIFTFILPWIDNFASGPCLDEDGKGLRGSGRIIWKGVPCEALQGVTEDTVYDCAHDPAESRNLCIKTTAPSDPCTVSNGVKEDLSKVIPYPESTFHDPVGHASGRVEVEDLFVSIHSISTKAANCARSVSVRLSGNDE